MHEPEAVIRETESGNHEPGILYFVEKVVSLGPLNFSYEYNLYRWPLSQTWTADVISPHGWHDVGDEDLTHILDDFGLA